MTATTSSRCDGMDEEIKFRIPLAPVTKKNSQRILVGQGGRRFVAPSETYKAYEQDAAWFIPKGVCIDDPVNIRAIFRVPTHRRVDLTNLLEALDDVLVKAGFLADDNSLIVAGHDGSRVVYDKANPGTEVTVTKMKANDRSQMSEADRLLLALLRLAEQLDDGPERDAVRLALDRLDELNTIIPAEGGTDND